MAGAKEDDGPTVARVAPDAPTRARPSARASGSSASQVFAKRDPRSDPGRRSETRKPLDFSGSGVIDRFELIRELARGGMGQVFLARDTKLGRKVAIKFLLRDDPTFVQRFLVEARATARCTHENIVTIFEVGEHDGLPYMVLEYLEGKTLSEVLDSKPGARQLVELMVPVARALERAHEHGIIHRDLKPSNIFVTDRGQVKVLDFGVARVLERNDAVQAAPIMLSPEDLDLEDSSVTFTGSNSLVGTMPYMSPEQWGIGEVDHLSDIWAVGIIFWRALAGVHPAGTMQPEKLRARMTDLATPLPSLGTRGAHIPPEIVAIVDHCLDKHKAGRYQSAGELLADLQAFLAPRSASVGEDELPYRGLAAFGEDDARYFFGRSSEIRTAVRQLETWPLLAVVGPSGVGKSSFVHAGLVPAVRASGGAWDVRVIRPGRAPLPRLASVLDDATLDPAALAAQIVDAPGLFGDLLRRQAARTERRVVVVVDQLEELFTLCDQDDQRRTFLAALLAAADDPSSPVRVVLSMRADFLDRLAGHKQFLAELSRGLYFLSAPDHENLREALVRPAELAGYSFEDPWILDDMLQVASSKGALPLLSFAAARLWEARDRRRRQLTVAAYNQMGGVGGAFAQHADQIAAAVPPQQQVLLRAILTRLVTPEGTRAVVDHEELLGLARRDRSEVEHILDQLVRARLVHVYSDPDQGATVEIVHEMLITEWPMLARWLEDSQAVRGFVQELRQAARQWAARGRSRDLLWRGAPALEALATQRRHVLELSETERAFLDAVRRAANRARRRRVTVVAVIFVALGAVIAGGAVAVVRIAAAEQHATEQAAAAEKEAARARQAEQQIKDQLAAVQAAQAERERAQQQQEVAEQRRQQAQKLADQATAAETMTKDELAKKNRELQRALAAAQEQQRRAEVAADVAKKATAEATAAKAAAEAMAAREHAQRVRAEQAKKQIYNSDLRSGPASVGSGEGGLK
ncbi:MAG TPA: serine/threonine-protein kinase [Kofleriaceae bacterium]|nr:serine/threonine-protein kinase [Kofleriaceae bacterium]